MSPWFSLNHTNLWFTIEFSILHGSLNVPIEHHPTIRYMVYNGYYKVMSNIPKMGQLPTPVLQRNFCPSPKLQQRQHLLHLHAGFLHFHRRHRCCDPKRGRKRRQCTQHLRDTGLAKFQMAPAWAKAIDLTLAKHQKSFNLNGLQERNHK